jgi:cation:H+ antiporter
MVFNLIQLILSLVFILFVCTIFTNAVEWMGMVLNLSHGVTGSILAAVGTALPETIIPIIAILFTNTASANQIGIGAIAGAPFMLSTLGFSITGLAVVGYSLLNKRKITMNADYKVSARDLTFFIIVYGVAILTTYFINYGAVKIIVPILLLLSYLIYVVITFSSGSINADRQTIDEFYLSRVFKVRINTFWIFIELIAALIGIVYGSHIFVLNVSGVSRYFGISPLILSILITPIATELPEKFNSVIWIGKKKDTLALGNITGAMVFQSCFPVAFGIALTPWNLSGVTEMSAFLAITCAMINLLWIKTKKTVNPFMLMSGGAFYIIFILYLILC